MDRCRQRRREASVAHALLERASSLISTLKTTAADIASVRSSAVDRVGDVGRRGNGLATEIGALNAQIAASPSAAHDLLDHRELLVARLAELTGAQPHEPSVVRSTCTSVAGRS